MSDTERLEWDGGRSWWEFRTYLSHGTARRVQESMKHALEVIENDLSLDWEKIDLHDLNEVMVLAGTVAWSYGSVTKETLETVPQEHYEMVLARMQALFGGLGAPLAGIGSVNSAKPSSLLSRVRSLFRWR